MAIHSKIPADFVIAIDGASASGKSTTAKAIAREYKMAYLDTGMMYRALTYYTYIILQNALEIEAALPVFRELLKVPLDADAESGQRVILGQCDITEKIRGDEVNANVSEIAADPAVRSFLIAWQKEIVRGNKPIVLEGRDTTTVVAPNANVRILLLADEGARLARRDEDLAARDDIDITVNDFLEPAEGVISIDNSNLSFDDVVSKIRKLIKAAVAGR